MMKRALALILALMMLATFGLAACDSDGPAEKAGEKIDESIESVKDAANDLGDKLSNDGPAEKAGEAIDKAVEDVKKAAE